MLIGRPKPVHIVRTFVLGAMMLLFGFLIAAEGYRTVLMWPRISAAYATYAVLWLVSGPAMFAGGVWLLASLGRNRIPMWIGGAAALLCGGSLTAGVLTYVIPCSGPS